VERTAVFFVGIMNAAPSTVPKIRKLVRMMFLYRFLRFKLANKCLLTQMLRKKAFFAAASGTEPPLATPWVRR
jgi:hypothetical protein